MLCGVENCKQPAPFRCSRCQISWYCSVEHQKLDWKKHKKLCSQGSYQAIRQEPALQTQLTDAVKPHSTDAVNTDKGSNCASVSSRLCRCMFCGEELLLESETAAVEHMEVCSCLQEQLGKPQEQFTIPSKLREQKFHS